MGDKIRLPDGTEFDTTSGEFEGGRTTPRVEVPPPRTYTPPPSTYYPYSSRSRSRSYGWDSHPFLFYAITLILSAAATWGLSILASILLFDNDIFGLNNPEWFDSVEGFLLNLTPYLIFLGGFVGCFWYNITKSDFDSFKDIILPVLSSVASCIMLCLAAAILTLVVIVVIAIIKVIIPIVIGIIVFFILLGG